MNRKSFLEKFGFEISKMEKRSNLLCDTNETFLAKQMARLTKFCSQELSKKHQKYSEFVS